MTADEISYEKDQIFIDNKQQLWILLDVIETRSLLVNTPPKLVVFMKRVCKDSRLKTKTYRFDYPTFLKGFKPVLSKDSLTIKKILELEKIFNQKN